MAGVVWWSYSASLKTQLTDTWCAALHHTSDIMYIAESSLYKVVSVKQKPHIHPLLCGRGFSKDTIFKFAQSATALRLG